MRANCFLDIEALGAGEDMPHYAVLSKAYHVLHGAFGGNKGKYAVAFPNARQGRTRTIGNVIRVFSETNADLYALIEKVKGHHLMRDYVRLSLPRDVPTDFNGKWMTWRRVRIQKKEGVNRDKTIKRANESVFFEIRSSGGNFFPLRLCSEPAKPQLTDFVPNSYGLASGGNLKGVGLNLFSLPVI